MMSKMAKLAGSAAVLVFSASAFADTVAYSTVFGTPGNQSWQGALGLDFNVNETIRVTKLGAFDDLSNGLNSAIQVGIFDRNTSTLVPGGSVTISAGSHELIGGSQFVSIPELTLAPGEYSVVAVGYGSGENNYNTYGAGINPTSSTNSSGGVLTFLNQWRYSNPPGTLAYPTIEGTDVLPTRFDAGTFAYVVPVPPAALGGLALFATVGGSALWKRRRALVG